MHSTSKTQNRRVVVTGFGLVSPLGNSPEALWANLYEGKSGVRPVINIPADALPAPFAAEALDFTGKIDDFGPLEKPVKKAIKKAAKMMCRETQAAVAAAQHAMHNSGLGDLNLDRTRFGIVFGSDYMVTLPGDFQAAVAHCRDEQSINGKFQFDHWGEEGLAEMSPLWLLKYLPNMPASHIAIFNDLRGPNNSLTLREASGNAAIGEAFNTIRRGHADQMLAGATGTRIHPLKTLHAIGQESLASSEFTPETASRPFDKNRSGMVLGEGSAVITLEEYESAVARGATIYAEILGSGSSFAASKDLKGNTSQALAVAMQSALSNSGTGIAEVGHIHAHGLSTRDSDIEETKAIQTVFGDLSSKVPVVAAKSHFGNIGAASGVVELIASIHALKEGNLWKTLNYETPDEDCQLNVVADNDTPSGSSFLNLSISPQGQAGVLLVGCV